MSSLLIPYGLTEDAVLVPATDAKPEEKYKCPQCGDLLIYKAGKIRRHHFSHKPNGECSSETVAHATAKLLIFQTIESWERGVGRSPAFERRCKICNDVVEQLMPKKVDSALMEYRLPNGRIVDIALMAEAGLMAQAKVMAAIEVFQTHKTDNPGIPFVEVKAVDVLSDPLRLRPIRDEFHPIMCKRCRNDTKVFENKCQAIARKTHVALPNFYYIYAPHVCWKCRKEMIVFAWPSDEVRWASEKPKRSPMPKSIKCVYTKQAARRYWANVCPMCGAVQGDGFLYSSESGPFFGVRFTGDGAIGSFGFRVASRNYREQISAMAFYLIRYTEMLSPQGVLSPRA